MTHMSSNEKSSSRNFNGSLQLTNYILDSGATCHMTPEILDFVPGLLDNTYEHIEVADVNHVTEK